MPASLVKRRHRQRPRLHHGVCALRTANPCFGESIGSDPHSRQVVGHIQMLPTDTLSSMTRPVCLLLAPLGQPVISATCLRDCATRTAHLGLPNCSFSDAGFVQLQAKLFLEEGSIKLYSVLALSLRIHERLTQPPSPTSITTAHFTVSERERKWNDPNATYYRPAFPTGRFASDTWPRAWHPGSWSNAARLFFSFLFFSFLSLLLFLCCTDTPVIVAAAKYHEKRRRDRPVPATSPV